MSPIPNALTETQRLDLRDLVSEAGAASVARGLADLLLEASTPDAIFKSTVPRVRLRLAAREMAEAGL